MTKKKTNISSKFQPWIDAQKRYHLSDMHIQMARELGLNPKKFGSIGNQKQEPWKDPLPVFIEKIYLKHFKKTQPDTVRPIKQIIQEKEQKKADNKARKVEKKEKMQADSGDQKGTGNTPL